MKRVARLNSNTAARWKRLGDAGERLAHKLLRHNGFRVTATATNDLSEISRKAGIPPDLQGCHTAFICDYVVDGHVPVAAIKKLLAERPVIKGITLPGMPLGSPGMTGDKTEPFTVFAIRSDGTSSVFIKL